MPPCPPPEFDLEAWEQTIAEIERRAPDRLALIHFGAYDDVQEHLAALRETLARWAEWVEDGMDEQTFVAAARHDVSQTDPELADAYDRAAPYWHHFRGIERYWRKRREATAGTDRVTPDARLSLQLEGGPRPVERRNGDLATGPPNEDDRPAAPEPLPARSGANRNDLGALDAQPDGSARPSAPPNLTSSPSSSSPTKIGPRSTRHMTA